eukprot:249121-Chlamydomonas_euryale.AAC.8
MADPDVSRREKEVVAASGEEAPARLPACLLCVGTFVGRLVHRPFPALCPHKPFSPELNSCAGHTKLHLLRWYACMVRVCSFAWRAFFSPSVGKTAAFWPGRFDSESSSLRRRPRVAPEAARKEIVGACESAPPETTL